MNRKETRAMIFILFALVWIIGPVGYGYADSLPKGHVQLVGYPYTSSESEVHIYHDNKMDTGRSRMIELCHRLEDDKARAEANSRTEVESYRKDMEPGTTEYHREIRESNRFADPADEQKTVDLCHQLEDSALSQQRNEVRVYREHTGPSDYDYYYDRY